MNDKLKEINKDIIKKIDELDQNENIKKFLKDALVIEYDDRDKFKSTTDERNEKYEDLIEKYYKKVVR